MNTEREQVWFEVELPAEPYASEPTWWRADDMNPSAYDLARVALREAGCDGPIERIHGFRPDYEGRGLVRDTYRSSRPKPRTPRAGQPMNPSGGAVDDASAPYGLAQTTTPSPDGHTAGKADQNPPPGPGRPAAHAGPTLTRT
jgi:hypothetical protein